MRVDAARHESWRDAVRPHLIEKYDALAPPVR